jgi:hypothetical protein
MLRNRLRKLRNGTGGVPPGNGLGSAGKLGVGHQLLLWKTRERRKTRCGHQLLLFCYGSCPSRCRPLPAAGGGDRCGPLASRCRRSDRGFLGRGGGLLAPGWLTEPVRLGEPWRGAPCCPLIHVVRPWLCCALMPDPELICHSITGELSHFFRGRYQDLYRGTDNPHFLAARKDPRPRYPVPGLFRPPSMEETASRKSLLAVCGLLQQTEDPPAGFEFREVTFTGCSKSPRWRWSDRPGCQPEP